MLVSRLDVSVWKAAISGCAAGKAEGYVLCPVFVTCWARRHRCIGMGCCAPGPDCLRTIELVGRVSTSSGCRITLGYMLPGENIDV